MSGDLYQTPGYAHLNALARAGSANVTVSGLATSAHKTRLFDGRQGDRAVWSASGDKTILVDRGAAAREPVNRLVLAGHNLAGHRVRVISDTNQNGAWSGTTYHVPYSRLRGTTAGLHKTIHPGVNVIDFADLGKRYVGVEILGRASNVPELGECWLTRRRLPSRGFDPNYRAPRVPNVAVRRLLGGSGKFRELGAARRVWDVRPERLYGADARIYERMLEETGYGRDPVLFDGTLGGYETTIEDFSGFSAGATITSWGVSNATIIARTYAGFDGGVGCEMLATGTSPAAMSRTLSSPLDLRGCIFRVAVESLLTLSYATATTGFQVFLGTDASNYAAWNFGTNHVSAAGSFYQLAIDLDLDTPGASVGNGCDPSAVSYILLLAAANVVEAIYWDDLHYLDKARAPLFAHVVPTGIDATQTYPNPVAAGEKWTLDLQIAEELA